VVLDYYNDPFYIGPRRQERAEWFAQIWHALDIPVGYHYRRIHYRMISQNPPVRHYNGGVYLNTFECWQDLNNTARDAAHLGRVPLDAFVDRRNPEPYTYVEYPGDARIDGINGEIPSLSPARFYMPVLPRYAQLSAGVVPQPYHIELWAEKSTMNDVLIPLAQCYHINLITGVGELSATACCNFINRIRPHDRPVRILYISDFDPAGRGMPVAVARKIEFELDRQEEQLGFKDVEIRPIILAYEQCQQYRLPRTPIKASERRGARFEERFGEGATELDALEALHPGAFASIATAAIEGYWNPDHQDEVDQQLNTLQRQMNMIAAGCTTSNGARSTSLGPRSIG